MTQTQPHPPAPTVPVTTVGDAPRPRRRGRVVATATAAALVLGGGLFAVGQMGSSSAAEGGATTPESAVDAMLASFSHNDLIGVLDHLAPGEREVLRDASLDYLDELQRIGVLRKDADLEDVSGFAVDFENMTYEVEQANARVWLVEVTGGQVTFGVDVAELPYGEVFTDLLGEIPESDTESVTVDIADELGPEDPPLSLAVIHEGGQYYVSSFYTAAETLAALSGNAMPATPIPAVGAASPEEAVLDMYAASIDLDVGRLIELTPPDEMAALHDYGPLLVDLAEEGIAESGLREEIDGFAVSLDSYEFETVAVSGGTKVLPVHIAMSMASPDGEQVEFSVTKVDTTCVDLSYSVTERGSVTAEDSGRYCAADLYEILEDADAPKAIQSIAVRLAGQLGQVGVVTVEVDGAWYVSPVRSGTDVLLVALQGLENGDIQAFAEWITEDVFGDLGEFEVD